MNTTVLEHDVEIMPRVNVKTLMKWDPSGRALPRTAHTPRDRRTKAEGKQSKHSECL